MGNQFGGATPEEFWKFSAYVGVVVIEWSKIESVIDMMVRFGRPLHPRLQSKQRLPGNITNKIEFIKEVTNHSEDISFHKGGIFRAITRFEALKDIRDTIVHGVMQKISGDPPAISFQRTQIHKGPRVRNHLDLTEEELLAAIEEMRAIHYELQVFSFAFLAIGGQSKNR